MSDGHLAQGSFEPICQFNSVVVGPEMHEEQPQLLLEHVAVPFSLRVVIIGFSSSAVTTKSPVIAAFPLPVGWKLIPVPVPIAGGTVIR